MQLVAQGIQKVNVRQSHQIQFVVGLSDGHVYLARDAVTSRIQTRQITAGPTLDFKTDDHIVTHNHRPHIQVMRGDRRNHETIALGENDGTSTTERVTCTACGRGNNQSITPITI